MPYTLYAPQARTVRMRSETVKRNINAILVEGFTFCEMVILIGEAGISVTHVDVNFPTEDIEREINWVGKNCQKILIYREENLKSIFRMYSPQKMLQLSEKTEKSQGVLDRHKKVSVYSS